jgi:acetyltransferase-like isoleucine patch superfamily enzyme
MAARGLDRRPSRGPHNSLLYVFKEVSRWRVAWNVVWIGLAKKAPWFSMRRSFLRLTGMKVGKRVAWALDVQPDVLFPQLIHVGDNSIIGYNTTILCHDHTVKDYAVAPVTIGRNVTIGANCTLLAGVTIADGSVVSADSLVNRDVDGFVGGVPARPLTTRGQGAESES